MKLRFYNRDGRWYADIPEFIAQGGTEEECEMIAGADTWLDYISHGKDSILLNISTESKSTGESRVDGILQLKMSDEYGAHYSVHREGPEHILWLCPVTLFLFKEYPKTIYYEEVLH